jgi:hypothetical protein
MDAAQKISAQKALQTSGRGERLRIVILAGYMEWILTPAETDGHYCMLEAVIPPGAGVPPHQHVDQEAFYIVGRYVGGRSSWPRRPGVVSRQCWRFDPRAQQ